MPALRRHCPDVTEEMIWILTSCDPEDEDALYDMLASRSHELHAGDMRKRQFKEAAKLILLEVRSEMQERGREQYFASLRSSTHGGPGDTNAG